MKTWSRVSATVMKCELVDRGEMTSWGVDITYELNGKMFNKPDVLTFRWQSRDFQPGMSIWIYANPLEPEECFAERTFIFDPLLRSISDILLR